MCLSGTSDGGEATSNITKIDLLFLTARKWMSHAPNSDDKMRNHWNAFNLKRIRRCSLILPVQVFLLKYVIKNSVLSSKMFGLLCTENISCFTASYNWPFKCKTYYYWPRFPETPRHAVTVPAEQHKFTVT
jgi:hypothetical protein